MFYPDDINRKAKRQSTIDSASIAKALLLALVIVTILAYVFLSGLLVPFGIPRWFTGCVQVLTSAVIGIMIFRFMIFREQDRMTDNKETFITYYGFNPVTLPFKTKRGTVEIYQLADNSYCIPIQFRYGTNNKLRKKNTEDFLKILINECYQKHLTHRYTVTNEVFSRSALANRHYDVIDLAEDELLKESLKELYKSSFDFVDQYSSVQCLTMFVYAKTSYQLDDLETFISLVQSEFSKRINSMAFREITFMNTRDLLSLFESFYGMESIDISELPEDYLIGASLGSAVKVYKVTSDLGSVMKNDNLLNVLNPFVQRVNFDRTISEVRYGEAAKQDVDDIDNDDTDDNGVVNTI